VVLTGELNDTKAGRALAEGLPFTVQAQRWGEEFYGNTDKKFGSLAETAQEVMEVGDLAYHDDTGWFCIFWGPTPSSQDREIRAAFPVQKVGRVQGDWDKVGALQAPVAIRVEPLEQES
ncbi:MAG: cyclophilin-like fold protein, partial [Thermodesulfobacteriota bacterium]